MTQVKTHLKFYQS